VEAVIGIYVTQKARTLGTVEMEYVHRFVAHAQEHRYKLSLWVDKVIHVIWTVGNKSASAEVKEFVALGVLNIGRYTQEIREAHQEYQVKIREIARTRVEPVDGFLYITI
jgi:hypothetical protein